MAKKTAPKKIEKLNRTSVDMKEIYEEFYAIESAEEKIEYLRVLEKRVLPIDVNFKNLIEAWSKKQ
jgi:hypothetical protein